MKLFLNCIRTLVVTIIAFNFWNKLKFKLRNDAQSKLTKVIKSKLIDEVVKKRLRKDKSAPSEIEQERVHNLPIGEAKNILNTSIFNVTFGNMKYSTPSINGKKSSIKRNNIQNEDSQAKCWSENESNK